MIDGFSNGFRCRATTGIVEFDTKVFPWATLPAVGLEAGKEYQFNDTKVIVVDSVDDYADLMQSLFDFDLIASAIKGGELQMCFDGMHAVTGPYAKRIFGDLLGVPGADLFNCVAKADFGGGHPDPNRVYAKSLYDFMLSDQAKDLGAASDGDGDRNMIMGKGIFVSPSDSLALIAEHHGCIPQFKDGLVGVARSMPTSTALDRVAQSLNIPCYETPTGWKFFGNLLDEGMVRLCGEESFGTSGDHVREKDGVWTVLCWMSILANLKKPVAELLQAHWVTFGRSFYCRHDYEGLHHPRSTIKLNSNTLVIRNRFINRILIAKHVYVVYGFPSEGFANDARLIANHTAHHRLGLIGVQTFVIVTAIEAAPECHPMGLQ